MVFEFIENKYSRWYFKIVESAKNNPPSRIAQHTLIKDDKIISISNVTAFCRENKLNRSNLNAVIFEKIKSYAGYTKHVQ